MAGLLLLAVLQGSCASRQAPGPAPKMPPRPNILLVLLDDVSHGDPGAYGGTAQTPNIDGLAAEGMRFTSFYAASPVCSPTRFSILTGRHPLAAGLDAIIGDERPRGIPEDFTTLPELLGDSGYATFFIGKWHLGNAAPFKPGAQGFSHSLRLAKELQEVQQGDRSYHDPVVEIDDGKWSTASGEHSTILLTDKAIEMLGTHQERDSNQPFFMSVWYRAVHTPLELPADLPPECRQPAVAAAASRAHVSLLQLLCLADAQIGRIIDALDDLGLSENTLLLVTSDNGGEGPPIRPAGPLRGFKHDVLEGGIRVPLIARWPGRIDAGGVNATLAGTQDLFPTIAEVAGADLAGLQVEGVSLVAPLLQGVEQPRTAPLFWESHLEKAAHDDLTATVAAVRHGAWKLIIEPTATGESRTTLFDIGAQESEAPRYAVEDAVREDDLHRRYLEWRDRVSLVHHRIASTSGGAEVDGSRMIFKTAGAVTLQTEKRFDFQHGFSLRARVRPARDGGDGVVLAREQAWELRATGGRLRFSLWSEDGTRTDVDSAVALPATAWSDVAVTFHGRGRKHGVLRLQVTGGEPVVKTGVPMVARSQAPVLVGSDGEPFLGEVDDLRLNVVGLFAEQLSPAR